MASQDDQRLIDGMVRVAQSLEWDVVATDRSGDSIRVILQHPKTPAVPTPQK